MLNANKVSGSNKSSFEPLEPGTYPARLVRVVGLGLHPVEYKGEKKDDAYSLRVTYELSDEFLKDEDGEEIKDKPRWIDEEFNLYPLKSDRAKSTARYYALDPLSEHDGDWSALEGAPVLVTIVNNKSKTNGKVYENISLTSPMRDKEAKKLPALVNDWVVFDPSEADVDTFLKLPEFYQDKITSAIDFPGSDLETAIENMGDKPKKEKAKEETSIETNDDVNDEEDW